MSPESSGAATTTTKFEPHPCDHCGKPFNEGDSYVLRDDGSIRSCMHWHIREENK